MSVFVAAETSDNFIVGVWGSGATAVIGRYPECGRYPGSVPAGATVKLQCRSVRSGQYAIVQFPTTGQMNFREVDVCGRGEKRLNLRPI